MRPSRIGPRLIEAPRPAKRGEKRLRDMLALSFDASPLGMMLTAPDGSSLHMNRAFAEMVGCDVAECGDPLAHTHPADREDERRRMAALHAGEVGRDAWEQRYLHADGRIVWAHVSAWPLRGGAETARCVVSQITDVTERRRRDDEEDALRHLAELVAEGAGPASIFAAVAERLGCVFDASTAAVVRFDRARHAGIVQGGWAADGTQFTGAVLPLDGVSGAAAVFRTGQPARIEQQYAAANGGPACDLHARLRVKGGVAAPIVVGGELWGNIGVGFGDGPVPVGGELRLERFARLLSLAIANAEAWEALARQASTDALTGLANTRTFHERLRAEVKRARRHGRDLSVVLLDLDHFKLVNDLHGHQEGDRVLAEVGRRLAAAAREGETVARIGGEEFAWLMPETDRAGALAAAERVRRSVAREPFAGVGTLTLSAGLCSSAHECDADALVRRADRALYWAKDSGRNRTFAFSAEAEAVFAHGALAH